MTEVENYRLNKGILLPKEEYVIEYPQAIEFSKRQANIFWHPDEIDVSKDLHDLKTNFTPPELHGIIYVLKLFTLYERRVGNDYWRDYISSIFKRPEIENMSSLFSAIESSVHAPFYNKINEVLGLDTEDFYNSYKEDSVLLNRMMWLGKRVEKKATLYDILKSIGTFSIIEGAILFSSFAFIKHFNSLGKNKLVNINAGINFSANDECLIDTTEVLTPEGWINISKIDTSDLVAQFNPVTEEVSFVNPSRVIVNDFDGDLISFEGKISQSVTPNHRMLVKSNIKNKYSFKEAKDIKYHCYNYIPVSGYKIDNQKELSFLERFLIMTQADGSVSNRYTGERHGTRPVTFSFSKQRKIDRFLYIVSNLGYKINEGPKSPKIGNRNEQRNFRVNVPVSHIDFDTIKSFNWVNLLDKSSSWCSDFIDELSKWDGYINDKQDNYVYYSSTNKSNIDKIQAITALCGRHATYSYQDDDRSENFNTIHRIGILDISKRNGAAISKTYKRYTGKVYCLTVPTSAFIIRDSDKVSITGNCIHSEAGAWLFNTILQENIKDIDRGSLVEDLLESVEKIREHEFYIIDNTFSQGEVEGILPYQLKFFVESRLDICMENLGIKKIYKPKDNPITEWFYSDLNSSVQHDFFVASGNSYNRKWDQRGFVW
jgi:ribonucleotide reductase beta subunit family protein with ferritin-like domain